MLYSRVGLEFSRECQAIFTVMWYLCKCFTPCFTHLLRPVCTFSLRSEISIFSNVIKFRNPLEWVQQAGLGVGLKYLFMCICFLYICTVDATKDGRRVSTNPTFNNPGFKRCCLALVTSFGAGLCTVVLH